MLLPGYVPQDEVPLWYAAADVFAYPSAYEGFGLPVLEALACGATVVTARMSPACPRPPATPPCRSPPGDAEALAQAIRAAVRGPGPARRAAAPRPGARGRLHPRGHGPADAGVSTTRALAGQPGSPRSAPGAPDASDPSNPAN